MIVRNTRFYQNNNKRNILTIMIQSTFDNLKTIFRSFIIILLTLSIFINTQNNLQDYPSSLEEDVTEIVDIINKTDTVHQKIFIKEKLSCDKRYKVVSNCFNINST